MLCSKETGKSVEELHRLIEKMKLENKDTNFEPILKKHLTIITEYKSKHNEGVNEDQDFSDRQSYQVFSASTLFYMKIGYQVFQKKNLSIEENYYKDCNMAPLEFYHYTEDEKEMKMNQAYMNFKKQDILHCMVLDDTGHTYSLKILNKYGDSKRLIDCSLKAELIKRTSKVMEISPPLQTSDLIRAAVFGTRKPEEAECRKLVVTLNPGYTDDPESNLGRVFREEIPFFPEDCSEFKSFGQYLESNNKFMSPKEVFQHVSTFQCDPLKTGPFYETVYKKRLPSTEEENQSDSSDRIIDAMKRGCLKEALRNIENVLKKSPENDAALTERGKIYLAMAGGLPSRKVKKALLDFWNALNLNCSNEEAIAFYDLVLKESIDSFSKNNKLKEADAVQAFLMKRNHVNKSAQEFLERIKEEMKVKAGATKIKQEPMDT